VSSREKLSLPAINVNLMIHLAKLWAIGGHRKCIAAEPLFPAILLTADVEVEKIFEGTFWI
jgi:hypothetical protein